tara:strand:+ start:165 stop:371 length:207 start_codon:yes stop_codon:yes gene_type:complete
MTEWQGMQQKPIIDFRKFLQKRLDKTNTRRQLAKDEATKVSRTRGYSGEVEAWRKRAKSSANYLARYK